MHELLEFEAARDRLIEAVSSVASERVDLAQAAGRVLARDLVAEGDIPPFDRSPYDGYAFCARDSAQASEAQGVTLRILEEIPAGAVPTQAVVPGTAVKVLTGAPVPPGADAVCKFEDTAFTAQTVTLHRAYRAGENVVRAGEDVRRGTLLAAAGTVVDAGLAGTLAAQGVAAPLVYGRLRVGIVSTGSEVVEAHEAPPPGKIRNANRHTLAAALQKAGMTPVYLGLAGDDVQAIAGLIARGLETCDALLLTGGVSVGDYDLTPAAMEAAGVTMLFRGVKLKPGMACAYGVRGGKPVCGLSGNPASALTNFYCIALPALRRMAGQRQAVPGEIAVTLSNAFRRRSPGTRVLRGRLDLTGGTVRMIVPEDQGNVVLSSTIGCDVMAIVPPGSGPLAAGTVLKGFLL